MMKPTCFYFRLNKEGNCEKVTKLEGNCERKIIILIKSVYTEFLSQLLVLDDVFLPPGTRRAPFMYPWWEVYLLFSGRKRKVKEKILLAPFLKSL